VETRPGHVEAECNPAPFGPAARVVLLAALGICGWAFSVAAQDACPARPIRLIMPFPPGGPTDIMGRLISQGLSNQLGQQVYVDNRPGAGSTLAAKIAANAEPDAATRSCSAAPRCSPSVRRFITTPNTIRKVCAGRHGCRGALCHGGEPQSADLKL